MARSQFRHKIHDAIGNVIQNALVYVYETGTSTAVDDLYAAVSGGSAVTTLTSDSQGDVIGYLDFPRLVDLKVTDNTNAAYYPSTPTVTLDWADFTESVEVKASPNSGAPFFYVNRQPSWTPTAGANNFDAWNEAKTAAVAAGGGTVVFPPGTTSIATRLTLSDNIHIRGFGRDATVIEALSGVSSSVIIGASGNTVSDCRLEDFTLDCGHDDGLNLTAIQITDGARVHVARVRVRNIALNGFTFTTCTECAVSHCRIDDAGGDGGATGFGILFSGGSKHKALHNWLFNVAGMGVGGNTNATDCEVTGNYIDKTGSAAYEGIGYTAGCDRWTVTDNIIIESGDNGISCSAAEGTIKGNIIDGCQFHGINGGNRNTITGNRIRNCGKANGEYAAVNAGGGDDNVVMGNLGYDDQGSPTMRYGFRETTGATRNIVTGNHFYGFLTDEFEIISASTKLPERVKSKTGTYTARQFETVLANGTFTVTLPGVAVDSKVTVKNTGSGTVQVATPGAETIDGSASNLSLAAGTGAVLVSDGTNWFRVAAV